MDEDDGSETREDGYLYNGRDPEEAGAHRIERYGHGVVDVQKRVADDAGQDKRDDDVGDGADGERAEDAAREIFLGIFCILGESRNGVKADVGEEDKPRRSENPAIAKRSEGPRVFWNEGGPICGMNVGDADRNEEDDCA